MSGRTLHDKIWDAHLVAGEPGGEAILYIDLHLIHEVTTPQAFAGLHAAGRRTGPIAPWRWPITTRRPRARP